MTKFMRRCSHQLKKWHTEFASGFKIFLSLILLSSFFTADVFGQGGVGTAPVVPPTGGLQIDGFLDRHTLDHGDWFNGTGAFLDPTGTRYLFNCDGTSPYASLLGQTLFWKKDPYTANGTTFGGTEDRFSGSALNDNPGTWKWDTHAPQSKDDINNAWFYIALDTINHGLPYPGNHWWAIMAGDREATNGTSYLDFEFLQAAVNKVAGGTFTTAGTDGGRTVNDIDVTLSFTGGGGIATATVFQWNPKGDGTFEYTLLNTLPVGSVFVQSNKTQPTPFDACTNNALYGQNEYTDSLQFVEGAIDITQLLGNGIGTACRALPFTTIFIKTKSSAATTAELKDFIAPFAIDVCSDHTPPTVTATGTPANGQLGCNPTTAAIDGALGSATATDACTASSDLTVTHTDGSVSTNNCNRSQTRTFSATDNCGNIGTTSRTATWTVDVTAPTLTATGGTLALGCNPSTATIDGALGTASATDACGTPTTTHTDGSVSSSGCLRSQTRTWTAIDACSNTATTSRTATWTADATAPTITATGTGLTLCNPSTADIEAALGTATATDACSTPTVTHSDGGTTGDCSKSRTRTFTATDFCGNTATTSRTAVWSSDNTAPTITSTGTPTNGALGCNPTTAAIEAALGTANATDACGTPTTTHTDGAVGTNGCNRSQTRTWTATDGCGNTATTSRTATWTADLTAPTITTTGNNTALGCNPSTAAIDGALGTASATDACSTPTVTPTDGGVSSDGCSRSQTRTWTAIDACGNTATASRTATWTADATPPTLTCSGNKTQDCGTTPSFDEPTVSDNCSGTPTVTHTDSQDGLTRTWTATDGCGNTATCSQTVTIPECAGHLFPTATTCCTFKNGSALAFTQVCFTVKGSGPKNVSNATPGVFFYYARIIAPSANFCIRIAQEKACTDLGLFTVQQDQVVLWDPACDKFQSITGPTYVTSADNKRDTATICVTGATAGCEYVLSIKYDTKSLVGTHSNGGANCDFTWKAFTASTPTGSLTLAAGSFGKVTAVSGCTEGQISGGTCPVKPQPCTPPVTFARPTSEQITSAKDPSINAYPNPYNSEVNFQFVSPVSGQAALEVYDVVGRRLSVVFSGRVDANIQRTATYKVPALQRIPLFYRLSVDGKTVVGKVLPGENEPKPKP
jgi:hypothetical protein